jgi:hypothetical protein
MLIAPHGEAIQRKEAPIRAGIPLFSLRILVDLPNAIIHKGAVPDWRGRDKEETP